jgi:murein L,D-transpeptidase YafK
MKHFCKMTASAVALLAVLCAASGVNAQIAEGNKPAVRIVIVKSARTMALERGGQTLQTYKVALGGQPVGVKQQLGDHKTPEGNYFVTRRTRTAGFIWHYISPIPTPKIEQEHESRRSAPGAM